MTAAYRVDQSGDVSETFARIRDVARSNGMLEEFLDASVWIRNELKQAPLEFGEARYAELIPDRLMLRFAVVRPIVVEFAVHEASKNVFIRRYALVKL